MQPPKKTHRTKHFKPVTLRDVAAAANVSTAAVSKVLHGAGPSVRVGPDRAAHIRAIAEQLNYRVNVVARNLRTSRTGTIGVFFENLTGLNDGPLYTSNLLDGVASVLFRRGYRLTLLAEIDHDDVIGCLGDGQLEGVIWCKLARDDETIRLLHEMPIPVVALNAAAPIEGAETVYVNCDNAEGMELAVDHLWCLGHRRIAFLYEVEERNTPDCIDRREGYENAISRRGGTAILTEWPWHLEGLADHLIKEDCTAVLGWTESVAGRLLMKLASGNVKVPEQLSVVGFDSTQYCETTTPRLTAVCQPVREMAAYATEALLGLIAGIPGRSSIVFPCTLDVRASTAAVSTE